MNMEFLATASRRQRSTVLPLYQSTCSNNWWRTFRDCCFVKGSHNLNCGGYLHLHLLAFASIERPHRPRPSHPPPPKHSLSQRRRRATQTVPHPSVNGLPHHGLDGHTTSPIYLTNKPSRLHIRPIPPTIRKAHRKSSSDPLVPQISPLALHHPQTTLSTDIPCTIKQSQSSNHIQHEIRGAKEE